MAYLRNHLQKDERDKDFWLEIVWSTDLAKSSSGAVMAYPRHLLVNYYISIHLLRLHPFRGNITVASISRKDDNKPKSYSIISPDNMTMQELEHC